MYPNTDCMAFLATFHFHLSADPTQKPNRQTSITGWPDKCASGDKNPLIASASEGLVAGC